MSVWPISVPLPPPPLTRSPPVILTLFFLPPRPAPLRTTHFLPTPTSVSRQFYLCCTLNCSSSFFKPILCLLSFQAPFSMTHLLLFLFAAILRTLRTAGLYIHASIYIHPPLYSYQYEDIRGVFLKQIILICPLMKMKDINKTQTGAECSQSMVKQEFKDLQMFF